MRWRDPVFACARRVFGYTSIAIAAAALAPTATADGVLLAGHRRDTPPQLSATGCVAEDQLLFVSGRGLLWHRQPAVTILARAGDSRIGVTRQAIDYWNGELEAMGSALRLGPVRVALDLAPDDEAYTEYLSRFLMERQRGLPDLPPPKFRDYCGSIVIVLADGQFISFGRSNRRSGIAIVGIKGSRHYPFELPNVMRNVIAHEIGHAIGLRHNADDTKLMCGRPAPCRPDTKYPSATPRFFPLNDAEKSILRRRYPS